MRPSGGPGLARGRKGCSSRCKAPRPRHQAARGVRVRRSAGRGWSGASPRVGSLGARGEGGQGDAPPGPKVGPARTPAAGQNRSSVVETPPSTGVPGSRCIRAAPLRTPWRVGYVAILLTWRSSSSCASLTILSRSGPGPTSRAASRTYGLTTTGLALTTLVSLTTLAPTSILETPSGPRVRGSEVGRAERAAGRCGWNVAEAARAVLHHRRRHRRRLVARPEPHVGHHDEEVHDHRDDQEGDHNVDEVAVRELAVVDREGETREVRLAEEGGDQRGDQVLDEGRDECSKSDADDDADRHVDQVAAKQQGLKPRHTALLTNLLTDVVYATGNSGP